MKHLFFILLLLLVALMFTCCKRVGNNHSLCTEWMVESFENISKGVIRIPPDSIRQMEVGFWKCKRVSATAPVNGFYDGECQVYKDGTIEIEHLGSTLRMGDSISMAWEDTFGAALQSVTQYEIESNNLKLYYDIGLGQEVMHLKLKQ